MICSKPHTILWAKMGNYPFWPAKLLSVEGNIASVRFFGEEHGRANLLVSDCYLYSQEIPNKYEIKLQGKYFHQAIKVII